MSTYRTPGERLPPLTLETDNMAVIVANVATMDFFAGLIDPDFARKVGHSSVFMNTMTQLSLMNRLVLEALPEARVKWHELTMRKPIYGGVTIEVSGEVAATRPFAGSKLAGPGTEIEFVVEIHAEGELRTKGKVAVVVP